MLSLVTVAEAGPSRSTIEPLIDAVSANPWGARFTAMRSNYGEPWVPYELVRARECVASDAIIALIEGEHQLDPISAQIGANNTWAALYVPDSRFGDRGPQNVLATLDRLFVAMPAGACGRVFIDAVSEPEWFERMGVPLLPKAFGRGLPWLVALDERARAELGEVQDDLFVSSEVRAGWCWLQLYVDPFDVESEDTRRRIERISLSLQR